MANMYIKEYRFIAGDDGGKSIQAGLEDGTTTVEQEAVVFSASVQSAAFANKTRLIRVTCDAEAFLSFGENPTATAKGVQVQADTPEFFGVTPGQKVAAYDGVS